MNLLYVGTLPPHPGGSAVSCAQLLAALAWRAYRVRAVAPTTPEAARKGDGFARRHPEIEVRRFTVPFFQVDVACPVPPAYWRQQEEQLCNHVERLLDAERPDLVLLGREGFVCHVPHLAARRGIPCVLRVGGPLIRALANGTYPADLAAPYLEGCRAVDLVVVQAPHMREIAERLGLRNVEVVPNVVDLALFAPRPRPAALAEALGVDADDVVVVHASNLKPVKRPLDVVRAAARALAENPRLVFVIVGDGEGRPAMEELCRRTGVAGRFRFVGWVDYAQMPSDLALADMVVMPSEFEQQARVYLETQAAGRLLIASAVRSAGEVVAHGRTGLLHRPADPDDLAAELLRAAADPALRARIGRQAGEDVARHSLARVGPQFAAALERVVRGRLAADGVAARWSG